MSRPFTASKIFRWGANEVKNLTGTAWLNKFKSGLADASVMRCVTVPLLKQLMLWPWIHYHLRSLSNDHSYLIQVHKFKTRQTSRVHICFSPKNLFFGSECPGGKYDGELKLIRRKTCLRSLVTEPNFDLFFSQFLSLFLSIATGVYWCQSCGKLKIKVMFSRMHLLTCLLTVGFVMSVTMLFSSDIEIMNFLSRSAVFWSKFVS